MEILAPAGDIASLKAAVYNGCDAVYFGAKAFNARIKADNFGDNLKEAVDFCHLHGVKVYLTINIMIKERELNDVRALVIDAVKSNVDAFIISDFALISIIKSVTDDVEIHFSTQMGVNSEEGAQIAKQLGADRLILSRETPLEEIKRISKLGVDVEYFVHGALCVGFSGQCLLSSAKTGESGNRGRCKQLCRLKYTSSLTGKSGYYLSARDICMASQLDELQNAGVKSLKIEGRLKSAGYVGSAVRYYRSLLSGKNVDFRAKECLDVSFNRDNGSAYLRGNNDGIIGEKQQNNRGVFIGKVISSKKIGKFYKNTINISQSKLKFVEISRGDGVKFVNNGVEIFGGEISEIENGKIVTYSSNETQISTEVYLTKSNFVENLASVKKSVEVNAEFFADNGKMSLKLVSCGCEIEEISDFLPQIAISNATDEETVKKQLSKTGDTEFSFVAINIQIGKYLFIPVGELNKLRRAAISSLQCEILKRYQKHLNIIDKPSHIVPLAENKIELKGNIARVSKSDQLTEKLFSFSENIVFAPFEYERKEFEKFISAYTLKKQSDSKLFLEIPSVIFEKDFQVLCEMAHLYNNVVIGFYVNNLSGVYLSNILNKPFIRGISFNVANNLNAKTFSSPYVASCELSKSEIDELKGDKFIFAEGRLPVMRFLHCVMKANVKGDCSACRYSDKVLYLLDCQSYPIYRTKTKSCKFTMYNCEKTGLSGRVLPDHLFLNLFDYSENEINQTVEAYLNNLPQKERISFHYDNGVL